jgi:hypothetical protein
MARQRKPADWLKPFRARLKVEVGGGFATKETAAEFLEMVEASPTLESLAAGDVQDRMRALLVVLALLDVVLDPVGRGLARAQSELRTKATAKRAEALREMGLDEKAAARWASKRKKSGSPGRKRSTKGDAIYQLETVLRLEAAGLLVRARRRLIADLVSEFVEPTTAEDVRLSVKDATQRDRRAATRSVKPLAAFLTSAESALLAAGLVTDKTPADRQRERHFSGARALLTGDDFRE